MARYINADSLLDYLRPLGAGGYGLISLKAVRQSIDSEPTADIREVMASAWIPVAERLPEFGWYLTSSDTGYNTTHVGMTLYNGTEWEIEYKVKAWMPLPEPYIYWHSISEQFTLKKE